MALVKIQPHLGDKGVSKSELRKGEASDSELAHADHADTELRESEDAAGELADGDHPFRDHGPAVGPVLERNVDQRQPQQFGLRFVLEPPAVPVLFGRVRRTAVWAS